MSEVNNPLDSFLESEEKLVTDEELFSSDNLFSEPNPPLTVLPAAPEAPAPASVPVAPAPTPAAQNADPFAAAMAQYQAQSDGRISDGLAEKDAVFSYGKAKDPITDRDSTFEDLRIKYEDDFPELSESKRVSWSVSYGKVSKNITNPGGTKIYDIKGEIETSKAFLDAIKKAKKDEDKAPECVVKPHVTAQSKGDVLPMPAYKELFFSVEEAQKSSKVIAILPSKDGRIYQMRKTAMGTFTAPVNTVPEFPDIETGVELTVPKIPFSLLSRVVRFFRAMTEVREMEVLVHILYDTERGEYTVRVPEQRVTHVSVHCEHNEVYPDHLIHVMDIHSHNTMAARFSPVDDADERATRLYAVIGRLNRAFPSIRVRACCGGQFIPVSATSVFDMSSDASSFPSEWLEQVHVPKHTETEESF